MEEKGSGKIQGGLLELKALEVFRAAVRLVAGRIRYILYILPFILVLIGLWFLVANHANLAKEFFLGVIVSLISSVLYSLALGVQTTDESRAYEKHLEKIKDKIVTSAEGTQQKVSLKLQDACQEAFGDVNRVCSEMEEEIRQMLLTKFPKYIAEDEYQALPDGFDVKYNNDLMKSISEAKEYCFFGPSAKYVAERVKHLSVTLETLRVVMVRPEFPDLLHTVLTKSSAISQGSKGEDKERQKQAYREELFGSIISIFDLRFDVGSIRIAFTTDPMVYRFDMTSEQTYLTFFMDKGGSVNYGNSHGKKPMPPAYRFSSKTLMHKMLRQELNQRFISDIGNSVSFTSQDTDEDLVRCLRHFSGNGSITKNEVDKWREEACERSAGLGIFLNEKA